MRYRINSLMLPWLPRRPQAAITRSFCESLEGRKLFAEIGAGLTDDAFANYNLSSINFGGLTFKSVDTAVNADGTLIVAGKIGANVAVARLTSAGALDTTFGSNGVFQTGRRSELSSVDVQGDGKIILGFGYAGINNGLTFDFAIGRILANGSDFDSAFGLNGIATIGDVYGSSTVHDVIVQRDGKIYAIGEELPPDFVADTTIVVVRYDQTGHADTTFSGDGINTVRFSFANIAYGGALDYSEGGSVGKLVVAGTDGSDQIVVARFTTTGAFDNTFDSDGKRTLSNLTPSAIEVANGVGVLANGKIVIGGYAASNGGSSDVLVTKLNVDGSTDTTFATNGVYQQDFGGNEFVDEVKIGYVDNILLGARFNGKAAILAMTTNGALDSNFNDDGIMTTSVPADRTSIDPTVDLVAPARRVYLAGGALAERIYDVGPLITIASFAPVISEFVPVGTSGSTSTGFVVARSIARDAPETIFITTLGSALLRGANRDVTTSGITIGNGTTTTTNVVIPAGQTFTTFTVTSIDDSTVEGDENLIFRVSSTSNYDAGSPSEAELTIRDHNLTGVGPAVTSTTFDYETAPQKLTIHFSQDVASTIGDNDFTLTGPAGIPAHAYSYNANNNTVTLSFNSVIPSGNYTLTATASGIANASGTAMAANYSFPFFFLAGDANHDRKVNFDDLIVLAQNYNKSGKTFSQGNFNYNAGGNVNFDDLIILAQKYNSVLPALSSLTIPPRAESGRKGRQQLRWPA